MEYVCQKRRTNLLATDIFNLENKNKVSTILNEIALLKGWIYPTIHDLPITHYDKGVQKLSNMMGYQI